MLVILQLAVDGGNPPSRLLREKQITFWGFWFWDFAFFGFGLGFGDFDFERFCEFLGKHKNHRSEGQAGTKSPLK